jgi:2-isopropylmalate synthase
MTTFPRTSRTPAHPAPADQPAFNAQLGSSMPFHRYRPWHQLVEDITLPDRTWPDARITRAPLWWGGARRGRPPARAAPPGAARPRPGGAAAAGATEPFSGRSPKGEAMTLPV